ncbi:MAG: flagellar biosynthesis protein FlhA, partial [Comamonadaceae bacterium]
MASALPTAADATAPDDGYAAITVEPVEVMVGAQWAPKVADAASLFMERIAAFRKQHAHEYGLVLPRIRFRSQPTLSPHAYEIHVDGALVARGEARDDKLLAIHASGDVRSIAGDPTRDPTYNLPALWIAPEQRDAAAAAQFTIVDAATVFLTHLTEVLRRESPNLLTRGETERILARVRQSQPGLVEELVPMVLAVADVQKVLQNLLREKVSIRHIDAILETLGDAGRHAKEAGPLTEAVRQRLGHAICQGLAGQGGALHVLTLDPAIEARLLQNLQGASVDATGNALAIEPRLLERFLVHLMQQAEKMMKSNLLPVLLCAPTTIGHGGA